MNIKKPSQATPSYPTKPGLAQDVAQQQFKSRQASNVMAAGKNGVILHDVGCAGNHLGKC